MPKKNKDGSGRDLTAVAAPHSRVTEQFRRLRTNIKFSSSQQEVRSLIVASAAGGEGKSTVAANLAVVYAQDGKRILLVDGDMRKPELHKLFRMQNDLGLSDLLIEKTTPEVAIRKTFVDNLDLLASGPVPSTPAELLSSKTMDRLMDKLEKSYDLIIFDSPPMLNVVDGQIIANKCDGSLLVVDSGQTDRRQARKAKETITSSGSRLIGVVLNNHTIAREGSYQ